MKILILSRIWGKKEKEKKFITSVHKFMGQEKNSESQCKCPLQGRIFMNEERFDEQLSQQKIRCYFVEEKVAGGGGYVVIYN